MASAMSFEQTSLRREVLRLGRDLNRASHDLSEAYNRRGKASDALSLLDSTNDHLNDLRTEGITWVLVAVILGLYMLDFFVFSAGTTWLLQDVMAAGPLVAKVGRAALPFLVIAADLFVGAKLFEAFQEEKWWQVIGWSVAGLCVLLMPGLAGFSTALAAEAAGAGRAGKLWITGLTIVAVLGHFFVLASGRHAAILIDRRLYKLKRAPLSWRLASASRAVQRGEKSVTTGFSQYYQALTDYNAEFTPPLPVGPFSGTTRATVNRTMGYTAIADPSPETTPQPTPVQGAPTPTPDGPPRPLTVVPPAPPAPEAAPQASAPAAVAQGATATPAADDAAVQQYLSSLLNQHETQVTH